MSIIIPNYNGERTIGQCLASVVSRADDTVEVIVVDDCSTDRSIEIIETFPVRLVRLARHAGAAAARNAGAGRSTGATLFFIDADCLLQHDTLALVNAAASWHGAKFVIGGTYTPVPRDPGFFSLFQSVFVNHFETKRPDDPDYIAAHAMVIDADVFRKTGGFPEAFLPIIEDVELSHRLRRSGYRLIMDPAIQVQHIFNFTFLRSLGNAFRKSRYWTRYTLANRDVLADSGTASRELKMNVASGALCIAVLGIWLMTGGASFLYALPAIAGVNAVINGKLVRAFAGTGGMLFAFLAYGYYSTLYAFAVGLGALFGTAEYVIK